MKLLTSAALDASLCITSVTPAIAENIVGSAGFGSTCRLMAGNPLMDTMITACITSYTRRSFLIIILDESLSAS